MEKNELTGNLIEVDFETGKKIKSEEERIKVRKDNFLKLKRMAQKADHLFPPNNKNQNEGTIKEQPEYLEKTYYKRYNSGLTEEDFKTAERVNNMSEEEQNKLFEDNFFILKRMAQEFGDEI